MKISNKDLENEYQKAWENWYYRVCPHGDCTDVHNQWIESCDYLEFCADFPDWKD